LLGPIARDGVANKEAAMAQSTQKAKVEPPELPEEQTTLFEPHRRHERLRRMSPERRAAYERIVNLRKEIGPISFDVSEAIYELRHDG
jgi:hypothetical protein